MKIKILGVKIDNLDIEEVLTKIEGFLEDGHQHYIVTPNPEFLVRAQKDKEFQDILNQADLAVCDGIGLIFASWVFQKPLKRIAGVDLMEQVCQKAVFKKWPLFLLGGRQGVSYKAAHNLAKKYPELLIKVIDNQGIEEPDRVRAVFKKAAYGPSILFLALGTPKQEKWIKKNLSCLPQVRLALGVGGAFDFMAGQVLRAPWILRGIGLEWFWRFLYQPWRAKRIFKAVIVFPLLVAKEIKQQITNNK